MKTLVNIFDPTEPLAAYLFLKEYYKEGDRILFVSAHDQRTSVAPYAALLRLPDADIRTITFKRSAETYIYEHICRRLSGALSRNEDYWVNLAGGTRYTVLAVQRVFARFGAKFFYVQTRENLVVSSVFDDNIYDNDDVVTPIRYRMTLAEYFTLHGLRHDIAARSHKPRRTEAEAQRIFDCFRRRDLSEEAFEAINLLRLNYRGMRRPVTLDEIHGGGRGRRQAIPAVRTLLHQFGFVSQKPDMLLPEEVDYLTGGWFEEYVFYLILRQVRPQQIALSVRIARPGTEHNNELDVIFVKANTLFVVECKTGIQTDHIFNEVVYKCTALNEMLLGPSSHSYIFTLKNDRDGRLSRVASSMGITLCDKGVLADKNRIATVCHRMQQISNERD